MIVDITNEVYTNIKALLPSVTVLQSYPSTVPMFPCVIVEEMVNITDFNTVDTGGEKYSDVTLEINIFSDAQNKITEVKNIRNQIDTLLSNSYRMNRTYASAVPNLMDDSIYRYVLRYTFLVNSNKTIYRR